MKQYVFLEDTQRSRHVTGNKVSAIIELCSYAIQFHTPCARAVQLNCVVLRVDRQCKCAAPQTWKYHREYAAESYRAKRMYDCRSLEQRECTIVDLQSSENVQLWICRAAENVPAAAMRDERAPPTPSLLFAAAAARHNLSLTISIFPRPE